jgi:hypothetical protein
VFHQVHALLTFTRTLHRNNFFQVLTRLAQGNQPVLTMAQLATLLLGVIVLVQVRTDIRVDPFRVWLWMSGGARL